ncbi:hypothetical protein CR513_12016, partial [Mucuna pruriens]
NGEPGLHIEGASDVVYQPWYIEYSQLEPTQSYELKSSLIHLLPKFHGLAGEDPRKHLKEFHVVCSTMRSQGIPKDYIKMKAFPFSLDGAAKDWLYLQPALFNTWGDMKHTYLEKFFPASKIVTNRKEIYGIQQHARENLHKYWERFNKLYATCPHPQINEQLLIQYFYKGLMMMDRSMIDAASGGALMDKTPTTVRYLISNMFRTRGVVMSRGVNVVGTVDNLRLENQLTELTSLVRQLVVSQPASTNPTNKNLWNMHFYGAPNRHVPHIARNKVRNAEIVGAIGGNQYGQQSYQTRSSSSQGQYVVSRFGSAPSMLAPNHNYY